VGAESHTFTGKRVRVTSAYNLPTHQKCKNG
jgi:hypothetical protein